MHIVAEDEVPGFVFRVYSIVKASALRNRSGCSAGFLDLWSGTYIPRYNAIHDCAVALFQIYIRFSPPKRLDLRSSQAIILSTDAVPQRGWLVGLSNCLIGEDWPELRYPGINIQRLGIRSQMWLYDAIPPAAI